MADVSLGGPPTLATPPIGSAILARVRDAADPTKFRLGAVDPAAFGGATAEQIAAAVAAEANSRIMADATLSAAVAAAATTISPTFAHNLTVNAPAATGQPSINVDVPNGSFAPLVRFNHQGLGGSQSNATYDGLNYPQGFVFNQTRIAADQLTANTDMGNRSGTIGQAVSHLFGGGAATGTRIAQAAFATMQAPMAAADPASSFFGAHWGFAIAQVNNGGTATAPKGNLFGYNPQVQLKTGATFWGTLQGIECDVEAQAGTSVAYKFGLNITTIGLDAVHASVREAALHVGAVPTSSGWSNGLLFSDFSGGGKPVATTGTLIGSVGNVGTVANGVDLRGFTISGLTFASTNFNVSGAGVVSAGNVQIAGDQANGSISIQGTGATPTPYLDVGPRRLIADVAGRLNLASGTLAVGGLPVFTSANSSVPTAASPVPSLSATQILLADGTYLTGTQLAALLGITPPSSGSSGGTPPAETLTVATPAGATPGTAYTVSGTYANGTPPALDYSTDGGSTWTAAASPSITSGSYSFSAAGLAAGRYTLKVRDHGAQSIIATSASFTVAAASALAYTVRVLPGNPGNTSMSLAGAAYAGASAGLITVQGQAGQTPATLDIAFGASSTTAPVKGDAGGDYGVNNYDYGPGAQLNQTTYPGGWNGGPQYIWANGHAAGTTRTLYVWALPTDGSASPAVLTDSGGVPIPYVVTY